MVCVCGHQERAHWRWGLVQGCAVHYGRFRPCQCRGFCPVSQALSRALGELFECVARYEHDWRLMDRIDRGLSVEARMEQRRSTDTEDQSPARHRHQMEAFAMTRAEGQTTQERVLGDWGRHWSSHDMDRLVQLFTDDVVYEDVPMGAVNHGKDQVRSFGEGVFAGFPDVTFEVTSRFASGTQGGIEWVMRGTHRGDLPGMPATGKRVDVRGASIVEFVDGRIRRCSDYWDMAMLLKQLGLSQ